MGGMRLAGIEESIMKQYGRTGLLLLLGIPYLIGCSGPRGVEKQIGAYIEKNCAGHSPCVIDLRGAAPFVWDKMYVFDYTASRAEIELAVGRKLGSYRELSRYFVFTKSGDIVRYEYETTNIEHPFKDQVVFAMPDSVKYQEYGADSSFNVSQQSSEAGSYYLLQPVK
jgi:hypothetical protein